MTKNTKLAVAYKEAHVDMVRSIDRILTKRREEFPGGLRDPAAITFDAEMMFKRMCDAGDLDEVKEAMAEILQLFSIRSQVDLEAVRESLVYDEKTLRHKALALALQGKVTQKQATAFLNDIYPSDPEKPSPRQTHSPEPADPEKPPRTHSPEPVDRRLQVETQNWHCSFLASFTPHPNGEMEQEHEGLGYRLCAIILRRVRP